MKALIALTGGGVLLNCGICVNLAAGQSAASAYTTGLRYDAVGRVVGRIAPDPDGPSGPLPFPATRATYDAQGLVSREETGYLSQWQSDAVAPGSWAGYSVTTFTDYTYDPYGRRLTAMVYAADGTSQQLTQYSYDSNGREACRAVRMNPAAFSLSIDACALGVEGSFGPDRITRTTYDTYDHVQVIQKAYGTSLQQDYATYTRTPAGKPTAIVDANGARSTMAYDSFGRLVRWNMPSKTSVGSVDGNDYEVYGYDANGNRTSLRKRDGRVLTFQYDALNRVTAKIVPGGCAPIQVGMCTPSWALRSVYYGYDLRGLQTYARFDGASGEGVTTTYDGFGAVASSTTTLGGQSRTLGFAYDADGNRTRIAHPDGTAFLYTYDGLDRERQTFDGGGSQLNLRLYGNAGRLSGNFGGGQSYSYDGAGRLSGLNTVFGRSYDVANSFGYNPAGQLVSESRSNEAYAFTDRYAVDRSYGVNGQNQYTGAGPASFQYDANGNLYSDGPTGYVYDAENRLVWTSASGGTNLAYDPLGRLWQVSGSAGTTQFVYDGDQLTLEYDGAGAIRRRHVHGMGEDDPTIWYEGGGQGAGALRYTLADRQGSIVLAFDGNFNQVAINTYDEYGIPGANNQGRFQYTGQAWLPEIGMYHYKARIYSPTLGRFLQTDPIGYDDQVNLYAYVANDPVNGRDPTGERTIYVGGGCDGYCTKNTTIVQTYAKEHGGVFFSHYQDAAIRAEMADARAKGEPVILIGHSWGGSRVMQIAADPKATRPDLLVTVDPVGKGANLEREKVGGLWVNVTATRDDPKLSGGNYVADLWGKTDRARSDRADVTVDSPRIHEDFSGMFRDARVPEMVDELEKHKR